MPHEIRMLEIPPSPNNMKARIALGFKGLVYEREIQHFEGYPGDRSDLVQLSSQPLTPVLVHQDTVIFDSGAILRYLDANFRDTPPLFSSDFTEIREIEQWERFGRYELAEPVNIVFDALFRQKPDPAAGRRAGDLLHELTGRLEDRLMRGPYIVGERMTAADVTAVPLIWYGMLPEEAGDNPVGRFFLDNLKLGKDRERTREWVARVIAHDPFPGG